MKCHKLTCGRDWDPSSGPLVCGKFICPIKDSIASALKPSFGGAPIKQMEPSAKSYLKRSFGDSESQPQPKKLFTPPIASAPKPPMFSAPIRRMELPSPVGTSISQVSPPQRSQAYYNDPPEIGHLKHSLVAKDALIPGIKLMVMGYECIKEAIGAAGDLLVCDPPKSVKFEDSKKNIISAPSCDQIRMASPHQFLQCAGHLSVTPTRMDLRKKMLLPCQLIFEESKAVVTIIKSKATERLYFQPTEGKGCDLPYWGVVELLKTCGFENDAVCAKHLLARLRGENVALEPAVAIKLDSVNALIIGLEGSRNNLTYLTAIMAMEMVMGYQFDFHTAFECTGLFDKPFDTVIKEFAYKGENVSMLEPIYHNPKFPRQYLESLGPAFHGGVYPMATFGSGGGHFSKRSDALLETNGSGLDPKYDTGQWPKRIATWSANLTINGVAVKELDLILSWLKRKRPSLRFMTAYDALVEVKALFKETIAHYYPKKSTAPAINIPHVDNQGGNVGKQEGPF